jgi:hypothetical protein
MIKLSSSGFNRVDLSSRLVWVRSHPFQQQDFCLENILHDGALNLNHLLQGLLFMGGGGSKGKEMIT